jgi:phage-related protein
MPITLPASFDSREEPQSTDGYLWLVEVQLQRPYRFDPVTIIPALVLRACNYHEPIIWPISDPSGSVQWEPFNFEFSTIGSTQEGDLPSIQLTVDNTARVLMRHLHDGDGLEGNTVKMHLVPQSAISIAYPNHEEQFFEFDIASATANDEVVTFKLERANFFTRQSPQDRFSARRCRREFGGIACGYVQNALAAYTTCNKTVSDCELRGDDHVARGLPRLHPERFGGFPGIPKQR